MNKGAGNLSKLEELDISNKGFSGIFPDIFGSLTRLKFFSAESNKFTGQLPTTLVNSPSLEMLILNNNSFSGSINLNCSAMKNLTFVGLGSNQFHGPIPGSLSNCQRLEAINLADNHLNCGIPVSFKNLQSLNQLSLSSASLQNLSATLEVLSHCRNVNTRGAFLCCRKAANRFIRGGGGRIIMLSSSMVGALRPKFGAYAASKAAIEAMTHILAKELKGTGITANCVAPGPIATEMYFAGKTEEQVKSNIAESPLSRLGEAKDVAPLEGFLATDAGEWVNGQVIRVNGGYI